MNTHSGDNPSPGPDQDVALLSDLFKREEVLVAHVRKQPSGRWQGVAFRSNGRRYTKVFPLKKTALTWATEQEREWSRGREHDPRAGDQLVGDWIDHWERSRVAERTTLDKNAVHLRRYIRPQWESWRLGSVRRAEVGAWVQRLEQEGLGAHTIVATAQLFGVIMRAATEEGRIAANPCARMSLPTPPAKAPFFWTRPEAALILAELPSPWNTAAEFSFNVGFRPGELLGLKVESVDWAAGQAHVTGVMTRHGWRAWPKSKRSKRTVPIPEHLLDALRPLVVGRPGDAFVFSALGGGPMSDVNFRNRVWNPALRRAGACAAHRAPEDGGVAVPSCSKCTPVPKGPPHAMRHTAASWLVAASVDLYRVQALLGHESFSTTQRYAHLAPDAHDLIREVWRAASPQT